MDETEFNAWVESQEFAFSTTPKRIKEIWTQMYEEFDIPHENIAQIVNKLFALGVKEG